MSSQLIPGNCYVDGEPPALFYEGPDYMYSNFAAFGVSVDVTGAIVDWMTAEHAYQAAKFPHAPDIQAAIRDTRSAHDAKKIARSFDRQKRTDWDRVKLAVMEKVVRAKLAQHSYIRQKLLSTGKRLLIEDSPKDGFWGRGPDWLGHNHLGKIWMRLRDELRAETEKT